MARRAQGGRGAGRREGGGRVELLYNGGGALRGPVPVLTSSLNMKFMVSSFTCRSLPEIPGIKFNFRLINQHY